jgi:cytochrome c oxidase cbb3-type subunit 3
MKVGICIKIVAISVGALLFASCEKESGGNSSGSVAVQNVGFVQSSKLQAGGETMDERPLPTNLSVEASRKQYVESAAAVAEGQQLFSKYNCVGCHAHGGGDSGVPLMDDQWIYGQQPDQLFHTIVQGRPNGMPSFGRKIPEGEIWRLVAFVRSQGGLTPGVTPDRKDAIFLGR